MMKRLQNAACLLLAVCFAWGVQAQTPTEISVTSPASGDAWKLSSQHTVKWTTDVQSGNVGIFLYKGGTIIQTIVASTPNDGEYNWTLPGTASLVDSGYKIKVVYSASVFSESAQFSVVASSLTISSPVAGSNWYQGKAYDIKWQAAAIVGTTVKLDLMKNGAWYKSITSKTSSASGANIYNWTIPSNINDGNYYQVVVTDIGDSTLSAISGIFTIGTPAIYVDEPTQASKWALGATKNIVWRSNVGGTVNIELRYGSANELVATIATGVANGTSLEVNNTYSWFISSSLTIGGDYRIVVTEPQSGITSYSPDVLDNGGGPFELVQPYIQITSPNGGEHWGKKSSHTITWESNIGGLVLVYLLKNDGTTDPTLISSASGISNSGKTTWKIPAATVNGSDYSIRIVLVDNSSVMDESDNNFTIEDPYITLRSPSGGATWTTGFWRLIEWESNVDELVKIHILYPDSNAEGKGPIVVGIQEINYWVVPVGYYQRVANVDALSRGVETARSWWWFLSWNDPVSIGQSNDQALDLFSPALEDQTKYDPIPVWNGWMDPSYYNQPTFYVQVTIPDILDDAGAPIGDVSGMNYFDIDWQALESSSTPKTEQYEVLVPAGGENWTPASQQQVEWLSTCGEHVNLELRNSQSFSIDKVSATYGDEHGTFVVAGLVASKFPKGSSFEATRSQSGNNGLYTVRSVSESGGSTYIVVDTIVAANEATGTLTLVTADYVQVISQNVESYSAASNKYELGWKIDFNTPVGTDYKVRVTTLGANPAPTGAYPLFRRSYARRPPVAVESQDYFSISDPYIVVTSPNGGESFNAGQSNNITWATNASGEVKIDLLKGNYTISAVAYTFKNYVVTLAGDCAAVFSTANAKVKIYQSGNNDGVYAVASAVYEAGVGTKLTLSGDLPSLTGVLGYASWYSPIISATSNDGSYAWTIPYNLPIGEGKDYRVRIESITSPWKGTSGESAANFSIFNNAMVSVISPNGGENWLRGVQRQVLWRSNAGGTVNIDLVRGESEDVVENITQSALNSNDSSVVSSYTWSIPDDANIIPAANDYKIRIMVVDAANAEDVSDNNFSITSVPSIAVEAPATGASLSAGMSESITWVSNVGGDVKLELYDFTDSAVALLTIAESVDNRSSASNFSWTVPLSLSSGNAYFIKVSSLFSGKDISGSSGKFSIVAVPYIKVTYPNGGEDLDFGGVHTITWSTNISTVLGGRQYVKIELLNNEVPVASSVTGLPESIDNTQSFTWTIPAATTAMPAGSLYKIRITCVGSSAVTDSSDATFTLSQPGIKIISPAASVRWAPGREYNIAWTTNLNGSVKIDLLKAGAVVSTINGNAPNTGLYSWAIPSTLTVGSDYQIQISSNSSTQSDTSELFSVDGTAYIQLASPNGSEKWPVGFERNIIWDSNAGGTVKIELYKNNAFYRLLSSGLANSDGSYVWPIPTSLPVGDSYKIKVSSEDDVFVYDISDNNFSVQSPNLTVNAPNGGELWAMGSTQTISWSSNVMGTVRLELYQDGNLKKVIASGAPNISATNEYNWTITADDSLSLAANYKIRVTSVIDATVYDESDAAFSITAPYVTITAPNGGENWSKGLEQEITWSSNIGGSVEISLYKGGTLSQTIASSTPNDGSYLWTVPASLETGTDYRVQIKSMETLTKDISDNDFTITSNDIQIVQPNGGENWSPGSTYGLKWTSALGGNVKIDLYKTGVFQSSIVASTPNDGFFEWTIPTNQTLGTDYSVMITSVESPLVSKSSDSSFSITRFITVLSPNGGERIARGVSMPITWSSNVADNVNIYLYQEVGGTLVYHSTLAAALANGGSFTWAIPETLAAGNYSITITSVADALVTDSSNAVFVIEADQTLVVTAPNGGESWGIGKRHAITWTSNMGGTVKIELLGGSADVTIASDVTNSGSYLWLVPDDGTIAAGNGYTVRITCGSVSATSAASFTLSPDAYITLTYPVGGEILAKGFSAIIAWNKNVGGNVNIELLKSGNSTTLVSNLSNVGSYTWDVPAGQEIGADYQIKVISVEDSSVFGVSYANFSIAEPKLTVTSPANGVAWGVGTTQSVAWTSNFAGSVNIDLYKAGAYLRSIAKAVANSGSYSWVGIPALADGDDYSVRVSSVTLDSAYGLSDPFSIGLRSIAIAAPAEGASWAVGGIYQIAWDSNIDGNASLELGTYSGGVFTVLLTINGATALSAGSYSWTIPTAVADGDSYRVRLTSAKYGDTALNPGPFAIRKPFISVVAPVGGERWAVGKTVALQWTSNLASDAIKITLMKQDKFHSSISSDATNTGSFSWTIPSTNITEDSYTIEYRGVANSTVYALSEPFTLGPAFLEVTQPTSKTVWAPGTAQNVKWESNMGGSVNIDLVKNGAWALDIADSVANDSSNSFAWTIPADQKTDSGYQILVATTGSDSALSEVFSIGNKEVKITSPAAGDICYKGTTTHVAWDSSVSGTYTLSLSNGDILDTDITTPYYDWAIPASLAEGSAYTLTVVYNEDTVVRDTSGAFSILDNAVVAVSPTSFTHTVLKGAVSPANDSFKVWNSGAHTLNFTVAKPGTATWLTVNPVTGKSAGSADQVSIVLSYNTASLAEGDYTAKLTVTGPEAPNTATVEVTVSVVGENIPSTSLVSWLNASSGNLSMTAAGKVSFWPDMSDSANPAAQRASAQQPAFNKEIIAAKSALRFDGKGRMMYPSTSKDIGIGTFTAKTIAVVFQTGPDFSQRQMVYEQGSQRHGINLYIDTDGKLYFNAWNRLGDTVWGPTSVSVSLVAGTTYAAVLVFDQPSNVIRGYLNGNLIGSASGVGVLQSDDEPGAIGGIYGKTLCHDGSQTAKGFVGLIAELAYYNRVLDANQLSALNNYFSLKYNLSSDLPAAFDLGGLTLWLKADAGVEMDMSSMVKRWRDLSGGKGVCLSQESKNKQPQWQGNLVSGRPGLKFTGASEFMTLKKKAEQGVAATTVYVVFKTGADVSARQMLWMRGDQKSGLSLYVEGGKLSMGCWNSAKTVALAPVFVSGAVKADSVYVAGLVFGSGTLTGRLNGAAIGSTAALGQLGLSNGYAGAVGKTAMFPDGKGTKGSYFSGVVMEVLEFGKALDAAGLKALEANYLEAYGISE